MPDADPGGVRRHRRLSHGGGHGGRAGGGRRPHRRLPGLRARRVGPQLPARVRLLLPGHGTPGPAGASLRPIRRRAGLQPARHLLAAGLVAPAARRQPLRLRPPRPVPRAVPLEVPRRPRPAAPRPALPGAADVPHRRPRHVDERLVRGGRPHPRRQGPGGGDGRAHRAGPRPAPAPGVASGAAPWAPVPRGLPRGHGTAGRRRHRHPGRRRRRQRPGPTGHHLLPHGLGRHAPQPADRT